MNDVPRRERSHESRLGDCLSRWHSQTGPDRTPQMLMEGRGGTQAGLIAVWWSEVPQSQHHPPRFPQVDRFFYPTPAGLCHGVNAAIIPINKCHFAVNIIWKVYELVNYPSDKSIWAIPGGDLMVTGWELEVTGGPEYRLHKSFNSVRATSESLEKYLIFHPHPVEVPQPKWSYTGCFILSSIICVLLSPQFVSLDCTCLCWPLPSSKTCCG